jgi:hypothetical protein
MTFPHRAPFSLALARFGHLLCASAGAQRRPGTLALPLPRIPEFLPDSAVPTPDQAQEMRRGLARERSGANGRDR